VTKDPDFFDKLSVLVGCALVAQRSGVPLRDERATY
jgi:hypothetical protein